MVLGSVFGAGLFVAFAQPPFVFLRDGGHFMIVSLIYIDNIGVSIVSMQQ